MLVISRTFLHKIDCAANKSIFDIGAGRKCNRRQCISRLYIRRTAFYRSFVLNLASVPGRHLDNSLIARIPERYIAIYFQERIFTTVT